MSSGLAHQSASPPQVHHNSTKQSNTSQLAEMMEKTSEKLRCNFCMLTMLLSRLLYRMAPDWTMSRQPRCCLVQGGQVEEKMGRACKGVDEKHACCTGISGGQEGRGDGQFTVLGW